MSVSNENRFDWITSTSKKHFYSLPEMFYSDFGMSCVSSTFENKYNFFFGRKH